MCCMHTMVKVGVGVGSFICSGTANTDVPCATHISYSGEGGRGVALGSADRALCAVYRFFFLNL